MVKPTDWRARLGRLWLVGVAGLLCTALAGCPQAVEEPPADLPPGTDGGDDDPTFADTDGNFNFAAASAITYSAPGSATFEGQITGDADIDLFNLGALEPGARVILDVRTLSGNLDPVAALFDNREYIHAFNDDRAADASDVNPRLDVVVRGPSGDYFLGVTGFPGLGTTGRYRVTVTITSGNALPTPVGQLVYLNWRGGQNVVIPNVGAFNLPPFNAADLGVAYIGQTDFIKQRVQEIVANRFAGYNLTLRSSDAFGTPAEPHSTIWFGGENPRAFAISEQIDTLNADRADDAIVFISSYRDAFSVQPSANAMATAIGNTVAHEIGHLLGLVHTEQCAELMDSTCSNDALLSNQSFFTAPLEPSVFPVGFQNAQELLTWALGAVGL